MSHGLHGVLGVQPVPQLACQVDFPQSLGLKAVCHSRDNALLNVLDPVVLEFGHRWPTVRSGIHIRCCRGPGRS